MGGELTLLIETMGAGEPLKRRHTSEATGKIIFSNDDLVDIDLLCMRGDEKS